MKKLCVAGWALAALALTASSASAEIITLRCTANWGAGMGQLVHGVVLDTGIRSVRFEGQMYTVEGSVDGQGTVRRFDNERIEFGASIPQRQSWPVLYVIDRITGSFTYYSSGNSRASGSCERAQAAF